MLLTLSSWLSGLYKLFAFDAGVAEMVHAGMEPATAFNIATIVVQIVGSTIIIVAHRTWLGAGALGFFTGLTILLVHRFWAIPEEPFRTIAFHVSVEHFGMIGGLLGISILSARREAAPTTGSNLAERRSGRNDQPRPSGSAG